MAFGAQFKGTHGVTQIDQSFANFALLASGTVNLTGGIGQTNPNGGASYTIISYTVVTNLPSSGGPYVFAFRCDQYVAHVGTYYTQDTVRADIRLRYRAGIENPAPVSWYCYGRPTLATPAGNWGMKLIDPNTGVTRYDSRYNYLKILGELTHSGGFNNAFNSAAAYGTPVAFMSSRPVLQWQMTGTGGQGQSSSGTIRFFTPALRTPINDRVYVDMTVVHSQATGGGNQQSNYGSGVYYIIDVNGLPS